MLKNLLLLIESENTINKLILNYMPVKYVKRSGERTLEAKPGKIIILKK